MDRRRLPTRLLLLALLWQGACTAPAPEAGQPAAPAETVGAEAPAAGGQAEVVDGTVGVAQAPAASEPRAFLWRVQQGDATVFLLGSIHVGSPDFYPLPASVERAFEAASAVVFEVDMSAASQQGAAAEMMQAGMFPPGQTVWDSLSEETASLLRAHLEASGQPVEVIQQMRPWLLGVSLTMAAYMQAGLRPELGIDMHLHGRAAAAGKRVLAIETAADQIAALSQHPAEVQDLMLREALQDLSEIDEGLDDMVELWRSGDAEAMAAEIHESMSRPEYAQLYEALFLARNRRMADAVRGYLTAGGTTLVVVGSGHLVGSDSVIELLARDLDVLQL